MEVPAKDTVYVKKVTWDPQEAHAQVNKLYNVIHAKNQNVVHVRQFVSSIFFRNQVPKTVCSNEWNHR